MGGSKHTLVHKIPCAYIPRMQVRDLAIDCCKRLNNYIEINILRFDLEGLLHLFYPNVVCTDQYHDVIKIVISNVCVVMSLLPFTSKS